MASNAVEACPLDIDLTPLTINKHLMQRSMTAPIRSIQSGRTNFHQKRRTAEEQAENFATGMSETRNLIIYLIRAGQVSDGRPSNFRFPARVFLNRKYQDGVTAFIFRPQGQSLRPGLGRGPFFVGKIGRRLFRSGRTDHQLFSENGSRPTFFCIVRDVG